MLKSRTRKKNYVRPDTDQFWFNGQVPEGLGKVLSSIGNAVEVFKRIYRSVFMRNFVIMLFLQAISNILRSGVNLRSQAGSANTFGDEQLEVTCGPKDTEDAQFFLFPPAVFRDVYLFLKKKCGEVLSSSIAP
jgi:hypothetical protein